jgi:hypothetical protein
MEHSLGWSNGAAHCGHAEEWLGTALGVEMCSNYKSFVLVEDRNYTMS